MDAIEKHICIEQQPHLRKIGTQQIHQTAIVISELITNAALRCVKISSCEIQSRNHITHSSAETLVQQWLQQT